VTESLYSHLSEFNCPQGAQSKEKERADLIFVSYLQSLGIRGEVIGVDEAIGVMYKTGSIKKRPGPAFVRLGATKEQVYDTEEFWSIYDGLLSGENPEVIFGAAWKEELRKVGKPLRWIFMADALHALVGVRLFSDFFDKLLSLHPIQESAVGMSMEHYGAQLFMNFFELSDSLNDALLEADFSRFDHSCKRLDLWVIKDCLKPLLLLSEDDLHLYEWWWDQLTTPLLQLYDGTVVQLDNGNMSGNYLTVWINTFNNLRFWMCAHVHHGGLPTLENFRAMHKFKVYGDDTLGKSRLTLDDVARSSKDFGYDIKCEFKKVSDATFLKRKFLYFKPFGAFVPVHEDPIKAVASLVLKSTGSPTDLMSQIGSLLRLHWFNREVRPILMNAASILLALYPGDLGLRKLYGSQIPNASSIMHYYLGLEIGTSNLLKKPVDIEDNTEI
jgi:hypothetical protein